MNETVIEQNDTIAAIATPPGEGGISIIRLSGADSEAVLRSVFRAAKNTAFPTHQMIYGHVFAEDGDIDECMAVMMRAPRSYTREDVAEIHCHGGRYITQRILALCLRNGARLAEPGEFTRRAFLNGRIDLSQAEAVMSLIAAQGAQAGKAAIQQLKGSTSSFIGEAAEALSRIRAGIAACIDYPEEVSEEEAAADAIPQIQQLRDRLLQATDEHSASLLQNGLRTVLCGKPNVGKSSILNGLLGEDRAIVTSIPGTTRDTVDGTIMLNGMPVHLTDTAGIHQTGDEVEQIGIRKTENAMNDADVVLCVFDGSRPLEQEDERILRNADERYVLILNKTDLPPAVTPSELEAMSRLHVPVLALSAREPETLKPLKRLLAERAEVSDRVILSQPRHLEAAGEATAALEKAAEALRAGYPVDLADVDLHAAAAALARITGEQVDERLLDAVFSQFCVGK